MRERELADANAAIEGLQGQVIALKHENASLAKSVQVLSLLALLVQKFKCWLAFGVLGAGKYLTVAWRAAENCRA